MISIKVPPLGESIVEATVARWLKKEGDAVAAGDTLVELETGKVTVEVPALKAGVLSRQVKHDGDVVAVDDILGEIDESASGASRPPARSAATAEAASTPPATSTGAPPAPVTTAEVRASPAAKRVAAEAGIDLAAIAGTGRGGVVSKPDVIEQAGAASSGGTRGDGAAAPPARRTEELASRAAAQPLKVPAPPAGTRETREKMSTRRKRIAEHLLEAQHATAHLTTFNEIDMSAVSALRERIKERVEKERGVKLSFM